MGRRKKYTGYIYCITNLINGKRYVGQTLRDINDRWGYHKWELRNNRHINKHLQSAWNKYGEDNFKWEVLHELNFSNKATLLEALNNLEVMYISIWNLLNVKYGYNIASGGRDGDPNAGKTEEEMAIIKKKQSEAKKGDKNPKAKKVAQYTIQGEYIKTWNCIADARRELGVDDTIVYCCKGQQRTAGGYRWAYIENDIIPVLEPLSTDYKPYDSTPKPVAMYNLTGEYIRTFNSIADAGRELRVNNTSIVLCCKGQQRTAGGYRWSYLNGDSTLPPVLKPLKPSKTGPKPVAMYNLNGEYIKTWDCIMDARRELGVDQANITDCCKGRQKSAGGYRWSYLDEDGSIPVLKPLKRSMKGNPKPVAMLDIETREILKVFECVGDANEYLGKRRGNSAISACARGESKTAWGYKWKFVSDLTQEELEQIQEAI